MPERVGEGLRALVVDDEEVVRSVVVEVLEGMGFLATPVESLTAGRQKLAVDRYDLLVIDKNLPDGSGLSMAHEVVERSLDAQVVIISGYATLSSAVEALQTGVADFVVKPFDLADFRARLQRVIESLKLRRAYRTLFKELQEKNAILEGLATHSRVSTITPPSRKACAGRSSADGVTALAARSSSPASIASATSTRVWVSPVEMLSSVAWARFSFA